MGTKGIILAGGTGSRLYPSTGVVNKHLLAVYNKPMIFYPLSVLMLAGIRDIQIVSSPNDLPLFQKIFHDSTSLGLRLSYAFQEEPKGIADALTVCGKFIGTDNACVILGDNIFFGHGLTVLLDDARKIVEDRGGAVVFGHYVVDPARYGVIEFGQNGSIVAFEEKPIDPKSNWIVTGLYFYDNKCTEYANALEPSARGEMEITALNQSYLRKKQIAVQLLNRGFAWFDVGTHDSFLEASEFIARIEQRTGQMIGCIEEIAYRKHWITLEQLKNICDALPNSTYRQYLSRIVQEEALLTQDNLYFPGSQEILP